MVYREAPGYKQQMFSGNKADRYLLPSSSEADAPVSPHHMDLLDKNAV